MKGKHIITLYPENIKIYAKINPSLLYMRYLCENKRFYFIYSQKKTSILFTKLSPRLHQGRHFNLHKLPFEITILLSLFNGFLFHFH